MIPGMLGSLLSHDALHAGGVAAIPSSDAWSRFSRHVSALCVRLAAEGGPTWPARTILDRVAIPFCNALSLDVLVSGGDGRRCYGVARRRSAPVAVVVALDWSEPLATAWRASVLAGVAADIRWCYSFNGPSLRIFDAVRTHSRRFVEFDLQAVVASPIGLAVAWRICGEEGCGMDAAVNLSERHRVGVRNSLQAGVHDALGVLTTAFAAAQGGRRARRTQRPSELLDESLVVVYRVLFLLFAEARGLVPMWHPVYREGYTVEALRGPVEALAPPPGLWQALQAMTRLAHRGCRAGTLRVPPFNGRLFSPAQAPLAESMPLDDGEVRKAVLSLTTRRTRSGRERIAYADLGVEHLGGVYERVLDYQVTADAGGAPRLVPGGRRKASGTFYTPRSLTDYVVRRTLAPLVTGATSQQILALRILDPAMGSGAFLVAACRYLAAAYETALIQEGVLSPMDVAEKERADFRRLVAQRTLFGVDLNPMAVQLSRLSLWLTTLSGDRPLTFFDHHLRAGNSLVGARLADLRRGRSGRTRPRARSLPLLEGLAVEDVIAPAVALRLDVRDGAEDTLEQVRAKETLLARIQSADTPLGTWKAIADLWCAGWFERELDAPTRSTFGALVDSVLGRPGGLPPHTAAQLLRRGQEAADRERFFHWELEFPEVFRAADGSTLPTAGFDAIIGNPPWEMLRGDTGSIEERALAACAGARLTRFARGSGAYCLHGGGHANIYQLFLERALALGRRGGRVGMILPWGIAADHGCATLRRHLFDHTAIDSFVSVENRDGLFPIHRGLKFVLMTLTKSSPSREGGCDGSTTAVPLRAGVRAADEFDRLPDLEQDPKAIRVTRRLIERFTGEQLAIPDLRSNRDVAIVGRIAQSISRAGDPDGWNLKFGRELNATDDHRHFNRRRAGLPVIEGKHVRPFVVELASVRDYVPAPALSRRLGNAYGTSRVAYRDVASSTNRLTLIAAVLPPGIVTTHTLFCLKSPLADDEQHFVAGMLNSFVANYLVRLRVTTHVTVAIVESLPLPKPRASSAEFETVVTAARRLAADPLDATEDVARLQSTAALLYGVTGEEFEHVLETFPLVDKKLREACRAAYFRTV